MERLTTMFGRRWRGLPFGKTQASDAAAANTTVVEQGRRPAAGTRQGAPGSLELFGEARRGGRERPAKDVPDDVLVTELLARLSEEAFNAPELAPLLIMDLEAASDSDWNRFSRRRLENQFGMFVGQFYGQPIEGATVVELGCGSQNPFATLFLYLLLGARRGIGIDVENPQDPQLAARGLARVASLLLLDPRLVVGDFPVSRQDVAARLEGFDLAKLWHGDLSGVDEDRLELRVEPVEQMSLADGESDYVFSTSFLEHVPDVDRVLGEVARITRPGGWGWHLIDGLDHAVYTDPAASPLGFLEVPPGELLVHGSNRLRPLEYPRRWKVAGFEVKDVHPYLRQEVTREERSRFAEPWRSMPAEALAVRGALFFVRRRG